MMSHKVSVSSCFRRRGFQINERLFGMQVRARCPRMREMSPVSVSNNSVYSAVSFMSMGAKVNITSGSWLSF